MRISRSTKRRKIFLVFLMVLVLFAASGYVFSGHFAGFVLDNFELLEGSEISAKRCFYSFRDGIVCLLYTSPSPRDRTRSRMPSSA